MAAEQKTADRVEVNISLAFLHWVGIALHPWPFTSDIVIFVLNGDVKLQLTNFCTIVYICCVCSVHYKLCLQSVPIQPCSVSRYRLESPALIRISTRHLHCSFAASGLTLVHIVSWGHFMSPSPQSVSDELTFSGYPTGMFISPFVRSDIVTTISREWLENFS